MNLELEFRYSEEKFKYLKEQFIKNNPVNILNENFYIKRIGVEFSIEILYNEDFKESLNEIGIIAVTLNRVIESI